MTTHERRDIVLKNRAQVYFFEFAPILLRETPSDCEIFRKTALRNVSVEFSERLGDALGICYPEDRVIRLSASYFSRYARLLPYTLYHEMVHQFLFDIKRPWSHNEQFYYLMELFPRAYEVDRNVHIHMRSAEKGRRIWEKKENERRLKKLVESLQRSASEA